MPPPSWPLPAPDGWPFLIDDVRRGDWPRSRDSEEPLRAVGPHERYRLTGLLDRGGQANIWMAEDATHRGPVVVKAARPHLDRIDARRLQREARILDTVGANPHVVGLWDWGPASLRSAGRVAADAAADPARDLWMVLPVRPHWLIEDALAHFGAFGVRVGEQLAVELSTALAHLHRQDVVHRDVSPRNVLLTESGVALADLGSAWSPTYVDQGVEHSISDRLTAAVRAPRTADWFAPEVVDGEAQHRNRAADVFCWGLYVFAAVTGYHPWSFGTRIGHLWLDLEEQDRLTARLAPLRSVEEAVPDDRLAGLLSRALSRRADDRPTAEEIVAGLTSDPPPVGRRSNRLVPDHTRHMWARTTSFRRRSLGILSAVTLTGTVGLVWAADRAPDVPLQLGPTPTATASPTVAPTDPDAISWADRPPSRPPGRDLYLQSLTAPAPGWPVGTSDTVDQAFRDGVYAVRPRSKGDSAFLPLPVDAGLSDVAVSATATLRSGQGFWGVWCRGTDEDATDAYYFQISHTASIRILVLDGSRYGGGTGWKRLQGVDVSEPTTVSGRCADVPGAPVRLTMSVNGRDVLTYDESSHLLGPGYVGISAQTFGDVDGPTSVGGFSTVGVTR